jgi:hypothetical protein
VQDEKENDAATDPASLVLYNEIVGAIVLSATATLPVTVLLIIRLYGSTE